MRISSLSNSVIADIYNWPSPTIVLIRYSHKHEQARERTSVILRSYDILGKTWNNWRGQKDRLVFHSAWCSARNDRIIWHLSRFPQLIITTKEHRFPAAKLLHNIHHTYKHPDGRRPYTELLVTLSPASPYWRAAGKMIPHGTDDWDEWNDALSEVHS